MAVDKDSAIGVPNPPPPRPARRDAAIDAALRKFDGEAPSPSSKPEPWTFRHRYQLGAFATAALALVIFVPVALTGVSDTPRSETRELPQPKPSAVPGAEKPPPVEAPAPAANRRAEAPAPAQASGGSPQPAAGATENRTPAPPARRTPPPPIQIVESPMIPPAAPPVAPSPLVRMNSPPPPPPAPPPPPPPAAGAAQAVADRAEQQISTGAIVVTGTRIEEKKARAGIASNDAANRVFLSRLQAQIRANDRAAVAKLVAMPLRVNAAGGTRTYRDRHAIVRDFDTIFTPRVRRAILAQRPSGIFVRDQGAMIGDGELWFRPTCPNAACSPPGPVRITAVNP